MKRADELSRSEKRKDSLTSNDVDAVKPISVNQLLFRLISAYQVATFAKYPESRRIHRKKCSTESTQQQDINKMLKLYNPKLKQVVKKISFRIQIQFIS